MAERVQKTGERRSTTSGETPRVLGHAAVKTETKPAESTDMLDAIDDVLETTEEIDERARETLDALLAEIDGVIEANAQEFVDNFRQANGE